MIIEIQAKTLLARVKAHNDWFGRYYNKNLYRGCQHQCIYCDSRSKCSRIEDFDHDVLVKANAIELLRRELTGKRVVGTIGTGSMNDPYMPLESEIQLTRRALEVIAGFSFPVHAITKSDLVLRDLDVLEEISRKMYAAVTFTITTADDSPSKRLKPGALVSSLRLAALRSLSQGGLLTGVALMPMLPFIEDSEQNIRQIVTLPAENGARYILPAFGMTLRDRQRTSYYNKLDRLFPALRLRYEKAFGQPYFAPAQNADRLGNVFTDLCRDYGIPTRMPVFIPQKRVHEQSLQPRLL
jgi:DNA repair photolyase